MVQITNYTARSCATFTPIIAYTVIKSPSRPRSTNEQVRDWLHSNKLTEQLSDDRQQSFWSQDGRDAFILNCDENSCLIKLTPSSARRMKLNGDIPFLSHSYHVSTGYDLHLLKPLLRLGFEVPESRRLADLDLINERRKNRHADHFNQLIGLTKFADQVSVIRTLASVCDGHPNDRCSDCHLRSQPCFSVKEAA